MPIRLDAHLPEFHRGAPPQLPVRCATTGAITITTALNNGDTLDGLTLATGDRVLVKDNGDASNGIYIVGASPARSFDMAEGVAAWGAVVYVIGGTTNGGTLWKNTNAALPTIDATTLTFAQLVGSSPGTVTSVALTVPAEFSVSGSPVTTSGTLAVTKANETANTVWAGPTSGAAAAPTFRALVTADMPSGFGYHEVVMVTGSSPPDPVLNSAGDDWVYSS